MYIIAGLGNPGAKYELTRHNAGYRTVDILSDKWDIKINQGKHSSLCGSGIIEGEKVLLVKPLTYMNRSGEAVREAVDFYKTDPEKGLIVIYDDIDLPVGRLRVRAQGSAGGHNGMKDIIKHLGTDNFTRIRIGVGAKPAGWDLADWVLSRPGKDDEAILNEVQINAAEAVSSIITRGTELTMSGFNK